MNYKEFDTNLRIIDAVAYELRHLAHSFRDTGNQYMFQVLDDHADDLLQATKNITKIESDATTERLKQSEQMVYNTFAACVKPYLDKAVGEQL